MRQTRLASATQSSSVDASAGEKRKRSTAEDDASDLSESPKTKGKKTTPTFHINANVSKTIYGSEGLT